MRGQVGARALERSPWWWAALLAGAAVRATGLFGQVAMGDELHAFHGALELPLPQALTTYRMQAHCPPFNAWLRAGIELGLRPGEIALRVPILLCGLAALWLVPRWVARRLDRRTAAITAWLLALSPLLVYYSRFMRPYMPAALAAAAAAGAFFDFWRSGRLTSGIAYAAFASLAVWLHLLAAPFVAAPWLFAGLEAALAAVPRRAPASPHAAAVTSPREEARLPARRAMPPARRLAAVAGALAALIALWAIPAWSSLQRLAPGKQEPLALDARTWREGWMLLAGTSSLVIALLFAVLVVRGAAVLWRRDAALARLVACLVVTQLAALLALAPKALASPPIFARYLLVALVPLLVVAAAGLAHPWPRLPRWSGGLVAVGVLIALLLTGPLVSAGLYSSPFGLRPELLGFVRSAEDTRPAVPKAYADLRAGPAGAVIEFPARGQSRYVNALAATQRVHRRAVRLSPGDRKLLDPRLDLASFVQPEPEAFLAEPGAAFLVVHRDWLPELGPRLGLGPSDPDLYRRAEREVVLMRRQARAMIRRLRGAWGRPDIDAGGVAAWSLERVRRDDPPSTKRVEAPDVEPPSGASGYL